jgi:hypothetical protein
MAVCRVEKDLTLAKPPRLLLVPLEPLQTAQQLLLVAWAREQAYRNS